MDILRIADYTTGAQELLYRFVMDRPEIWEVPFETLSQHRTVRALTAHCIGAEQRWLARIRGMAPPARYEECIPESPAELYADFGATRRVTRGIILGADAAELSRAIDVDLAQWGFVGWLSVEEILFHIFNHESYHRGQCSMLLQHHALDPPNFDYIFFKGQCSATHGL